MKTSGIIALAIALLTGAATGDDLVLPYRAFGPQVISHELVGMEWWQWNSHGDSRPREYPIKVVVYWDQTLERTKEKFPVDEKRKRDFRYVDRDSAIKHLQKAIRDLEALSKEIDTADLETALRRLQSTTKLTEQDGARQPATRPESKVE